MKKRAKIMIEIDLDPVEGWGHEADDHVRAIQQYLERTIPHYNPTVSLIDNGAAKDTLCIAGLHPYITKNRLAVVKCLRAASFMSVSEALDLVKKAEGQEVNLNIAGLNPGTDLDQMVEELTAAGYHAFTR